MGCEGGDWSHPLSRVGVLAMKQALALASQRNGRQLLASEVADSVCAPLSEVAEVAARLRDAGLVEVRGESPEASALRWARDPREVSLYEIGAAVGERFEVCTVAPEVPGDCPLRRLAEELNKEVIVLLKTRKLGDLVAGVS